MIARLNRYFRRLRDRAIPRVSCRGIHMKVN